LLRVDDGMVANDWMLQRLADILGVELDRPVMLESTALGAAWLAGSAAGVWSGREEFALAWRLDRRFTPAIDDSARAQLIAGWRDAVRRTLSR
jgi:glycerol kinase